MLLFNLLPNPLIDGLKQMPENLTLVEFKDRLRELFLKLHKMSPELFEDKNTKKETFMGKLARSFECDPTVEKPAKVKNEALNGPIRTIRHMIYNHEAIKETVKTEEKKIHIPHLARLQILLAKRLSTLRIIKEQREHLLEQNIAELETLLTLDNEELKKRITEGVGGIDQSGKKNRVIKQIPISAQPLWQRRGRKVYRLSLARGVVIEIDDRIYRSDNAEAAQAALSKYLEVMFRIEPGSKNSNDLVSQILEASPSHPE